MEEISENPMKTNELGILERILMRRYGEPELNDKKGTLQKIWRAGTLFVSNLYYSADWSKPPASHFRVHQHIYGASCGGTLVDGSLKIAMPSYDTRFEIYNLRELSERPEVQRALELDPDLAFFMDSANVWYYGHKDGKLFVYDAPFDELYERGDLESELEEVIAEKEAACPTEEELAEITRRAELEHARDK